MPNDYRRLAVFIDQPSEGHFLWVIIESEDDPAVWTDVEASADTFDSWIEAHEAGNAALIGYVEDDSMGPVRSGPAGNDLDD